MSRWKPATIPVGIIAEDVQVKSPGVRSVLEIEKAFARTEYVKCISQSTTSNLALSIIVCSSGCP